MVSRFQDKVRRAKVARPRLAEKLRRNGPLKRGEKTKGVDGRNGPPAVICGPDDISSQSLVNRIPTSIATLEQRRRY